MYRFSFDGDIFPVMRHLDGKMFSQKAYALETKVGSQTTLDAPRLDGCRPELLPPTEGVTQRVYTWEWVGALVPDVLFAFSLRLTVEPPPRQPPPETYQLWSFWQADIAILTARQEQPGTTEVAIALDPAPCWWPSGDPVDNNGLMINSDLLIKTWWALCIRPWGAKDGTPADAAKDMPGGNKAAPTGEQIEESRARERNYGPTEKVRELAEAVKKLKDADPTRSMMDIAMELATTPDAIRHAYRSMRWKWERADRVRINR